MASRVIAEATPRVMDDYIRSVKAGQLDESGLDIDDLRVIITRMADTLVNMHHHRIKYPWQSKRAEEFGVPREAVVHPRAERGRLLFSCPIGTESGWAGTEAGRCPLNTCISRRCTILSQVLDITEVHDTGQ